MEDSIIDLQKILDDIKYYCRYGLEDEGYKFLQEIGEKVNDVKCKLEEKYENKISI